MKTVELSAALGQAQVVENLKNFVGVDAQGTAALMTPERLAAVAGGILDISEVDNDWNNVTKQGLYVIKGLKCTNMPTEAYNFGALIVFACMDAIVQFYITHNRREFYYRVKYVGASVEWDTWSLLKTAL